MGIKIFLFLREKVRFFLSLSLWNVTSAYYLIEVVFRIRRTLVCPALRQDISHNAQLDPIDEFSVCDLRMERETFHCSFCKRFL